MLCYSDTDIQDAISAYTMRLSSPRNAPTGKLWSVDEDDEVERWKGSRERNFTDDEDLLSVCQVPRSSLPHLCWMYFFYNVVFQVQNQNKPSYSRESLTIRCSTSVFWFSMYHHFFQTPPFENSPCNRDAEPLAFPNFTKKVSRPYHAR